jgi:beta-galactosidase
MPLRVLALCAALAVPFSVFAQRQDIQLGSGWRFHLGDLPVASSAGAGPGWDNVAVPHTWNALDAQDGRAANPGLPDGYYRGPGWYQRLLSVPPDLKDKRVFARFEGASVVAYVFLNGQPLGQHRGAFGAFALELTPYLRGDATDELRVCVSNARVPDVAPLQGDFSVFGGLYRPVHLLVTDAVCITPLEHGSSGVFLTTRKLDADRAEVEVRALVSNGLARDVAVEVEAELADATGRPVLTQRLPLALAAGATGVATLPLSLAQPRLWQGRRDPYLYTVTVRVHREGRAVDAVTQPLGLRTVEISDERGALLNGEPQALHGVNRHQDRQDRGWALTPDEHAADIADIVELGCTTLRLAHYQQSANVHALCDRAGLLVWQEIPLVDRIHGSPECAANARQQLTEMILQGYNNPSLCFWGLFNELKAPWAETPGAPPEPLIAELRELARSLDPSRPTVGASWFREGDTLHAVPGAIAFNVYPGWYWGVPGDFTALVEHLSASLGGRRIGISEYGAGASIHHHQEGTPTGPPTADGPWHPEEWQAIFHEQLWAQMKDNPLLWGTWVWNMYDFACDKRSEGDTAGRNDKGLVTYDRKTRKDAFYFYKANWNPEPMVHVSARRMTPRKLATTEVKVYSNCTEVELAVNGRSLGRAKPDALSIARWPEVKLQPGENRIEVVASGGGVEVRDACLWVLAP